MISDDQWRALLSLSVPSTLLLPVSIHLVGQLHCCTPSLRWSSSWATNYSVPDIQKESSSAAVWSDPRQMLVFCLWSSWQSQSTRKLWFSLNDNNLTQIEMHSRKKCFHRLSMIWCSHMWEHQIICSAVHDNNISTSVWFDALICSAW